MLLLPSGDLFDPRESVLLSILDPAVHFPAEPFASSPILLLALHRLGMRKEVTLPVHLAAAQSLKDCRLSASGPLERSRALLAHLNAFANHLLEAGLSPEDSTTWQELRTTAWCPVLQQPLEEGMPWVTAQDRYRRACYYYHIIEKCTEFLSP